MQTTKKPHNYHKIAVWQKDDRIRKSPLKFYVQYYSILSGDFQALIITELWRAELWRHIYCFICYRIDEQRAEIVADQGHQGLEAAKPGAADHHGLGGGEVLQVPLYNHPEILPFSDFS